MISVPAVANKPPQRQYLLANRSASQPAGSSQQDEYANKHDGRCVSRFFTLNRKSFNKVNQKSRLLVEPTRKASLLTTPTEGRLKLGILPTAMQTG